MEMEPSRGRAEEELKRAETLNPGGWADHSRYVAKACENIAGRCEGMDSERAYILGLLHDIGRYAGISSEKHLLDGYRFCMERGWEKPAQICITHAFVIQDIGTSIGEFDVSREEYRFMEHFLETAVYDDYDRLVQLGDSLALPTGFCILEKRFVDVAVRYGTRPVMARRWKATFEIRDMFEKKMGCCLYDVLPGAVDNSLG